MAVFDDQGDRDTMPISEPALVEADLRYTVKFAATDGGHAWRANIASCPEGAFVRVSGIEGAFGANHRLVEKRVPCTYPETILQIEKHPNPF